MKILLKTTWSRAVTDEQGKIVSWNDYKPGDTVEVDNEPPLVYDAEYILEGEEQPKTGVEVLSMTKPKIKGAVSMKRGGSRER